MRSPTPRTSKTAGPTAARLVSLGAERLAELLAAAAKADRALMRSLSLELAGKGGGLGDEIDKQITRLRTAKGRLDARRATALVRELKGVQATIVTDLGADDPAGGLSRLLDLIDIAGPVLGRRSYDADALVELFLSASSEAGALFARLPAGAGRHELIAKAYRIYLADEYGVAATLIEATATALDADGRTALRALMDADLRDLKPDAGRGGLPPRDLWKLTQALCDMADAEGDVDAFIAARRRRGPRAGGDAEIAARLLAAGRGEEALAVLEAARPGLGQSPELLTALRIDALEAVGRTGEAQAARWDQFQANLSVEMLRAYLKRLPDFEDVVREEEALDWAQSKPKALDALAFLAAWPDRRRAGALVRTRLKALDGEAYAVLTPAAGALAAKDPLAATLLYRLMISDALRARRSGRYGHAARHLAECSGLAASIADWEGWPGHEAYLAQLRGDYPRIASFWARAASA
jgi:hypothetical protein